MELFSFEDHVASLGGCQPWIAVLLLEARKVGIGGWRQAIVMKTIM